MRMGACCGPSSEVARPWAGASHGPRTARGSLLRRRRGGGRPGPRRPTSLLQTADGSNQRRVTAGGRAFAPLWAPDGRTLVYAERAPGPAFPPHTLLIALDVETGESRRLLDSGPMTA